MRFSRNCKCLEFVSFLGNSMWIHTIRYSKYYPGKFGTKFRQPQQQTNPEREETSITILRMHFIFLGVLLRRTPVALWWNFQVIKRCATLCIPGSPSQLWASVRRCLSTLKTRCFLWFCKQVCVSSTHPGISDFKPWSEVKVSEKPSPTKVHP